MKISQKLIFGFIVIVFFVGMVGYFGIKSSRQVLESFGEHEEHCRDIIAKATEVSSYAKRAEGHLLLYLSLHDEIDREKFFKRYESLQEQIKVLNEMVRTPEAKTILDKINLNAEKLVPLGRALIEIYEKDMEKTGRFEFEKHSELIRQFHDITSSLRERGVELSIFKTDMEIKTKATAIKNAESIQNKILASIMFAVMIALFLGYTISKSISNRVIKLKKAIAKVGKGELDTLIRAESKDEIGQLASAFQLYF